jgi:hypothetical protein
MRDCSEGKKLMDESHYNMDNAIDRGCQNVKCNKIINGFLLRLLLIHASEPDFGFVG